MEQSIKQSIKQSMEQTENRYNILFPLSDEHYYNLILESNPSNELIIETYNFIKLICNLNSSNKSNQSKLTKKLLRFIRDKNKTEKNSLVWLVLIKLLPYSIWIMAYSEYNALKYFWSKELLDQIIDSNRNAINVNLLNNQTLTTLQNQTSTTLLTQTNANFINLLNHYDLNWNFTEKVLSKRLLTYIGLFNNIFDDFDICNFCSDQTLIKLLGSNANTHTNTNANTNANSNKLINFYPILSCILKIKYGIEYTTTSDDVTVYYNNYIIKFNKYIVSTNDIFSLQNVYGVMNFTSYINATTITNTTNTTITNTTATNTTNTTTTDTNQNYVKNKQIKILNILATAYLYQEFNRHQLRSTSIQVNQLKSTSIQVNQLNQTNTNKLIAQQHCAMKFTKYNHPLIYSNIGHNYLKCYECKKYFDERFCLDQYEFYCFDCSIKHYTNKMQKANLNSYTVFITGIRVKIGLSTALRILRNGGKIIGTTRYPSFALANYAKQPDYNVWKSNLTIIKCDFLNINSVYKLLDIITSTKYQINAFINMAFRTVKTSSYYNNAVREIDSVLEKNLLITNHLTNLNHPTNLNHTTNVLITNNNSIEIFDDIHNLNTNVLVNYQTQLSTQLSTPIKINIFDDVVDVNLECSWDKTIDQIDPKEIVECTALNQLVPTLIINSLKPKLVGQKFIINICSLEGQFSYNKKTDKHIHTNMCKSALNMLIRSLSEDLDDDFRAFSIDPGYVSGKKTDPGYDELPVKLEDSAAKITWPIFRHFNKNPLPKDWIKIRNYEKEQW